MSNMAYGEQKEGRRYSTTFPSLAYNCLKFPECGWIAVNNVPPSVVRRETHDVTVEVEYYWINPGADGWIIVRSNGPGGAERWEGNDINTHKDFFRANQWAVWTLRLRDTWFGTRPDGTDLLLLFGADPVDECYIRSVKIYETGRPEVYAVFGASDLKSKGLSAPLELNTKNREHSFFVFDPAADRTPRQRTGVEVIYGQTDGFLTVDGKTVSYGAGDVLFINPEQVRGTENATGSCYYLTFDLSMLETDWHNSILADIREGRRRFAAKVPTGHPANEALQSLCRRLIDAFSSSSPYKEVLIRSLLLGLLFVCCDKGLIEEIRRENDRRRMEYIRQSLEYIEVHLSEPLTVGQIADQVHLSEAHFARNFKDCVGEPPLAYINRLRLQKAADLLARGSTVTEAAVESGIPNLGHFIRMFKRAYGETPNRWRKNRNGEPEKAR